MLRVLCSSPPNRIPAPQRTSTYRPWRIPSRPQTLEGVSLHGGSVLTICSANLRELHRLTQGEAGYARGSERMPIYNHIYIHVHTCIYIYTHIIFTVLHSETTTYISIRLYISTSIQARHLIITSIRTDVGMYLSICCIEDRSVRCRGPQHPRGRKCPTSPRLPNPVKSCVVPQCTASWRPSLCNNALVHHTFAFPACSLCHPRVRRRGNDDRSIHQIPPGSTC